MQGSERQSTTSLRDEFRRDLRSSSPAIKRPASDMGAQDREEHTSDVDMDRGSSPPTGSLGEDSQLSQTLSTPKAKQLDRGTRHRDAVSDVSLPQASNPKKSSQTANSEDTLESTSDSLLPTPSSVSTAGTSIEPESSTGREAVVPPIDEQVSRVYELIQREPQDKQRGYLVSSKWLSKVLGRCSNPPPGTKIDKSSMEGEIGPVDNTDLAMVMEGSGSLLDEAGEPYVPIRPGLVMNDDFYVLPTDAWELVLAWHGNGQDSPVITRYAHDVQGDGSTTNILYELHPPIFSLLRIPGSHTTETQKQKDTPPPRFLASTSMPFVQWLRQAKMLLHIDIAIKVRIWRVLGGLRTSTASGIVTPMASRSSSPAPGAEFVASAGDHMLLDVNAFQALRVGDQRELLETTDSTADEKYNGTSTLRVRGLLRDEVIVLEEQIGGVGGGEWPIDNARLHMSGNKSLTVKNKGVVASGRSSPVPGIMTRGRQQRTGKQKGINGLQNMGNTCYMNSALQCIRSVEELSRYFLLGQYKKDLNAENPLAYHGHVAKAYANLMKQFYEDSSTAIRPEGFKNTVGKYGHSFAGYGQQDSQEFLLFLLDGLQEDLSRIKKKPYIEKPDSTDDMVEDSAALAEFAKKNWEIYKARNDSVITDLFAGMYKSTVTCPVCNKVSIIFDPFNNLTLQLPIENHWSKEVVYRGLGKRPIRIDVDLDKHASFKQIKDFVAERVDTDPARLIAAEEYKNRFYKTFDNSSIISESNIQHNDVIAVYELDSVPTNYNPNKPRKYTSPLFSRDVEEEVPDSASPAADRLLVPIFHRVKPRDRNQRVFFGPPSYIVISRQDSASYDGVLKKVLGTVMGMTTLDICGETDADDADDSSSVNPDDSDTVITTDDALSSDSNQVQSHSVQGEDGMVDVSMKDNTQPDEAHEEPQAVIVHPVLRPSAYTPPVLQNMFVIKVATTDEAIPTGWNNIEENKVYEAVAGRLPKPMPHRPSRTPKSSSLSNGRSGSTSSDEDGDDIEHDAPMSVDRESDDEIIASSRSTAESSTEELPEVNDILLRPNSRSKPYGRKDRRKPTAPRQPAPASPLIKPGEAIILDWDRGVYERLFDEYRKEENITEDQVNGKGKWLGVPTWDKMELFGDEQLKEKRSLRQSRRRNGISLADCLNEFGKSETLSENNAWYCPRCKEHRRAEKKFELWKAPDILVMHLKRFSSSRSFRDKIEVMVDYPVEGLDISDKVVEHEPGKSLIYDLIAVDNHYGGLGGGHYTAYAQNWVNKGWYEYNDAHVSVKNNPQSAVSGAAYLLFYRRRSDRPLGGPVLEKLIETADATADSDAPPGSREPSPRSGEDQRLGDSSHNGLSSAYNAAGQVHRVGDGGPATIRVNLNREVSLEDESRPTFYGPTSEGIDDLPPGYATETIEPSSSRMQMDEDEGIDVTESAAPLAWSQAGWSFTAVPPKTPAPPASEVEEDSTKAEGVPGSPSFEADLDHDVEFFDSSELPIVRGIRESAPPPETSSKIHHIPILPSSTDGDDDVEVQELTLTSDDR